MVVGAAPRKPSVLVTGADGFVGRYLCDALEADGFDVRRGTRATYGDIGPDAYFNDSVRGVEAVVHLAGIAHVPDGRIDESRYRSVNALGTRALAEAASTAGCKRFVFLSSMMVLGIDSGEGEWRETDLPNPTNAYAASKAEAEQMLRDVAERRGMEWVVLRPPLMYGPGVKANFRALYGIVARGHPLPFGALHNGRRLLSLGNLSAAIALALTHPAAGNHIFHVGDAETPTMANLIRAMAEAAGKPIRLLPVPPSILRLIGRLTGKRHAMDRLTGNIRFSDAAFRAICGWKPPQSLEDGLAEMARSIEAEKP